MGALVSIDGSLKPLSTPHPDTGYYELLDIGKPLSIELLTFFPGKNIKDWGNKAEIMISTNIRVGPGDPAPRLINMLLFGYDFERAEPIQDYGGHVQGDPMLYYTKAYTAKRIGLTLRGTEVDRIPEKEWKKATAFLKQLGTIAWFTPAAPYLGLADVLANLARKLIKAINRNDRITMPVRDLYFNVTNRPILQSGRYVLWDDEAVTHDELVQNYRLTSAGDYRMNVLVRSSDSSQRFNRCPYFVIKIDAKERRGYEDFEIGKNSAELLETWGNSDLGTDIFSAALELGRAINDGNHLKEIAKLTDDLNRAETDEERQRIKQKIQAISKLFTEENSDFMEDLLGKYLE